MNSQNNTLHIHHNTPTIAITATPHTYLEISKSAFEHNSTYYKNRIGAHNSLAIVIKANGYGHGLQHIAHLCEQSTSVDWLCVAQLSESLALHTTTKPILVLGYCDADPTHAIGKNIHFMVDSLEYAHKFNTIGKKHGYQFNVHIKVDTGLSRIGVLARDALTLIQQLQKLDYIKITGLFSHFAASNDNAEYTQQQLTQFNNVLDALHTHDIPVANIHMSNSAAISNIEYQPRYTMFRLGLGAYGFGIEKSHLRPVMTWKTRIVAIKTIPAGSYVSYACTYQTKRTTRIALLPIGYADGYDFRFSNKTSVLINDAYAPILGRVAMNITVVDVTDITAQVDDEVILLGGHTDINIQDLARIAEIPNVREIFTGINPALARIITE